MNNCECNFVYLLIFSPRFFRNLIAFNSVLLKLLDGVDLLKIFQSPVIGKIPIYLKSMFG